MEDRVMDYLIDGLIEYFVAWFAAPCLLVAVFFYFVFRGKK